MKNHYLLLMLIFVPFGIAFGFVLAVFVNLLGMIYIGFVKPLLGLVFDISKDFVLKIHDRFFIT